MDIHPQPVITKDKVEIQVDGILWVRPKIGAAAPVNAGEFPTGWVMVGPDPDKDWRLPYRYSTNEILVLAE